MKQYINISGKRIQHPLRLSDGFFWSPMELVVVENEIEAQFNDGRKDGKVLLSQWYDYEVPEMRGWIDKETFDKCFVPVDILPLLPKYLYLIEQAIADDGLATDLGNEVRAGFDSFMADIKIICTDYNKNLAL